MGDNLKQHADYVLCNVCHKPVSQAEAVRHPTVEIYACGPCYGWLILRAEEVHADG